LREFLLRKLPEYMLPSCFRFIDSIPVTQTGKYDRKQLMELEEARPSTEPADQDTFTELEEMVAGIWRQVLRCETVRVDDDFFELGGHSLLAMQVVTRIRTAVGIEVPLAAVFEHPTVRTLSSFIVALAATAFSERDTAGTLSDAASTSLLAADGVGAQGT
jgi:acyl carrier protein